MTWRGKEDDERGTGAKIELRKFQKVIAVWINKMLVLSEEVANRTVVVAYRNLTVFSFVGVEIFLGVVETRERVKRRPVKSRNSVQSEDRDQQ